ncbi:serine O-acetyltransferase EpsC [Paenibacillus hamazuiensis]|uniref:serine O-acetyltransferase EpsC n=1 Tax=Paenibacillus hamazuiensis TaxID=2936508 RepID=UPI00200F1D97|nr:serine O-acetyltransferase EpsC [Paenibacillus hamazuiensis]
MSFVGEIFRCLTDPGKQAISIHKITNWFHHRNMWRCAKFTSSVGRFISGIEIEPGAKIGKNFRIVHGMGVVIGATAEIGDNVTILHGVTLGIKDITNLSGSRLHPRIEDNVLIYAHAVLAGPIVIGRNSTIGANSFVGKDVPPNSIVAGCPAKVIKSKSIEAVPAATNL